MPFVNKSEIKSGSEITGSNYGIEAYQKCIRVGQVAADQVTRDMRRKKNTWKNILKNRAPSSRLPNNVEASLRQLGEGENSGNENQIRLLYS